MPLSAWLTEGIGWPAPFYFYGECKRRRRRRRKEGIEEEGIEEKEG